MEQANESAETLLAKNVCEYVCKRFVEEKQSTTHRELLKTFEDFELLQRLSHQSLLHGIGEYPGKDERYVPRLGAFVFSANEEWLRLIRSGMVAVARVLRERYFDDSLDHKAGIGAEEVLRLASATAPDASLRSLELGLFFMCQNGSGVQGRPNEENTAIDHVYVQERIVGAKKHEQWVEEQIWRFSTRYRDSSQDALPPQRYHPPLVMSEELGFGLSQQAEQDETFDWSLLHPEIQAIARKRFEAGLFADAVEASLKEVETKLKPTYKAARGEEKSGAGLMCSIFSPVNPVLLLGDLSTVTGSDMQKGYMQIFAGTMTGIRNPKAHGNIEIDANRALHFLFLASLLMHKIDEAQPVPQTPEQATT